MPSSRPRSCAGELAQRVAIAGDHDLDQLPPLGRAERREIGSAEGFQIRAGGVAACRHRGLFIGGGVDHAVSPVTDVLTGAAAEPTPAEVAAGIRDGEFRVEPAEAPRLAAADGAEAGGHGSNLTLTISVKRPLGRTAISVGAASWPERASASVTSAGTGSPRPRWRHQATAFWRA